MGIDAGIALLLMRQEGMWRRLRAAPLSRGVLLGSRVAGTALIAIAILAVVYLVARWPLTCALPAACPAYHGRLRLRAAGIHHGTHDCLAGGSVGATRGVAMFSVLILVMLGGAWVPAFLFPEWLQHVTQYCRPAGLWMDSMP